MLVQSAVSESAGLHAPCKRNHAPPALNPTATLVTEHPHQSARPARGHAEDARPPGRVDANNYCDYQPNGTAVLRHNSYLQALLSNLVPGQRACAAPRFTPNAAKRFTKQKIFILDALDAFLTATEEKIAVIPLFVGLANEWATLPPIAIPNA